nr:uncharacterized protein LOC133605782 [Nerophis lumbriciformis]
MTLAQKNCSAEQKHQSDQYNRKVKGQPLSLGEQVLLANKGVKGKRKLSDKWLPVIHTVVASKPDLHIYRIKDPEGNERVVHRNLLLQVIFLPLDGALEDDAGPVVMPATAVFDGCESEVSDTAAATVGTSHAGSLLSADACDDGRTDSWVHEQSSFDEPQCSESAKVVSPPDSGHIAALDPPIALSAPSLQLVPVSPPQASGAENQFASRFGRVIKPVYRFIESMVQLESILGVEPGSHTVISV